ncbi:MAG: PaaI family thioesterase [Gammaproteobacteria bacterium]|nr:PaaI family thioesterase [Gammaproteobacteria bacterium]MDH3371894.1 PaaI family thioesterase [Gammaproteobacteria bacterium]MDH3407777.1 PaaI family thioesterase [Gammaproteobacteria bacterium]MDH3553383.1 PaaI family thioesterase [Gammaproteobacteria bacterium]
MIERDRTSRQVIPPGFEQHQRHSGFGRHIGPYHLADVENDEGIIEHWTGLKIDDRHGGRSGGEYGHGGILMTLLDEAMGRMASRSLGKVCVTVSLQTSFCAPIFNGDFLRASATIARRGRNLVFVDGIARCGDALVGTASGVWMNTGQPLP